MNTPAALRTTVHLTEDQLDDALIGDLAGGCAAHLAACRECQARLADLQAPLANFNAVSLAWSERQSATMVQPSPQARISWAPRVAWSTAAVLALAFGLSLPLAHRSAPVLVASAPPASSVSTPPSSRIAADSLPAASIEGSARSEDSSPATESARDRQIASDNELLADISREIQEPLDSPSSLLGRGAAELHHSLHRHSTSVHDRPSLT